MAGVWIIGAGKFGLAAGRHLLGRGFKVVMVDSDRQSLGQAGRLGCEIEHCDGLEFLSARLWPGSGPDWIVPALPVHLAWEFCRIRAGAGKFAPIHVPDQVRAELPNPMGDRAEELYVSHAKFLCPSNCSEPEDTCTMTGRPRKDDMASLIGGIAVSEFEILVIQSRQLGPGVGGYRPGELFGLLERLNRVRSCFLLATACKCHGVISGGVRLA